MFWFEDTTEDPVKWHLQWMRFVGVQLPVTMVDGMAQAAVDRARRYINTHVGGVEASEDRTWVDEVGADVVEGANEILRAFLPPVLLARWGVTN